MSMRAENSPWTWLCAAAFSCVAAASLSAATVHVATTGNDQNPGTAEQPVATLRQALSLLPVKEEASEVIIHKGVYAQGELPVGRAENRGVGPQPLLLITAAKNADGSFEEVVFDGGQKIANAAPVEGKPGVFKIPAAINLRDTAPDVWEADARTRYELVADLAAVTQFPASIWSDGKELFFHTTDGRAPETHNLGMSRDRNGLMVWRQNTTVRGLNFRNYFGWIYSCGCILRAANSTIEDCHAWNCVRGFQAVDEGVENMRILRCTSDDCAGGVYITAKHAIVEDCRFNKIRDRFMIPVDMQDDCAIQYYYQSIEGEVRRNLCVGFDNGIFIKAPVSAYTVENNTLVGGITHGLSGSGNHPKGVSRFNIVGGFSAPIYMPSIVQGTVVDYECFWQSLDREQLQASLDLARKMGAGEHSIEANPRFAGPATGDYRLLPDSPCLKMGSNGENCGAFGAVGPDFKDIEPPTVTVSLMAPAQRAGGSGELYFERDPWNGGGRNLVRQLGPESRSDEWVVAEPQFGLIIGAEDAAGKPAQMKVRIGNGEWSAPEPYATWKDMALPKDASVAAVSVSVSDNAGNWSAPKTLMVRLLNKGPKLKRAPVVFANDKGVVLSFETDAPCLATVEYGADKKYGSAFDQPKDVQRSWISADGGDWVSVRSTPRVTNYLVLLPPAVQSGKTYHYRIILKDQVGDKTVGEDATFALKGAAKSYFVSPQGEDADGTGTHEKPWRTIQFAVDRALPGDHVVLMPGLYPGETKLTHGGLAGAPITLEAETPGTVILDGRHEANSCLKLERAPYVTIRGFEIRWFAHSGVYAADSSDVTVSHCKFWNHHWQAMPTSTGLFAHRSPGFAADHNVMYAMEGGALLLDSPRSKFTSNSCCLTLSALAYGPGSLEGAVCRNNSFVYCFICEISFIGSTHEQLATFDSDYNNFGTEVQDYYVKYLAENHGSIGTTDEFAVKDPFFRGRGAHKGVMRYENMQYMGLKAWQKDTGKDQHSIFKDPDYVDAEHGDYRLKPGSPNSGAGEGGTDIGALGVKEN